MRPSIVHCALGAPSSGTRRRCALSRRSGLAPTNAPLKYRPGTFAPGRREFADTTKPPFSLGVSSTSLARKSGGPLAPQSDVETAQMEQWALFAATSVETPALEMYYPIAEGRDKTAEGAGLIAVAAQKLRRPFGHLQNWLATHAYLVGNRFTAADINTAECVRYAQGNATLMAEFPAISDWLDRCQARPAFKAMWAARLAEPA